MKTIFFITIALFLTIQGFTQVVPDSLKGIYNGIYCGKTSNDTNWTTWPDTFIVTSIDTSICRMYYMLYGIDFCKTEKVIISH